MEKALGARTLASRSLLAFLGRTGGCAQDWGEPQAHSASRHLACLASSEEWLHHSPISAAPLVSPGLPVPGRPVPLHPQLPHVESVIHSANVSE